jgi:7,8-dihydropterin-6-yl-methyl-4-(beta-D-ribofuranosyl)aminobenzene 5'-phosphate synthase
MKIKSKTRKIIILYDNRSTRGFISDWGFSALILCERKKLLFDTGANDQILKKNMQKLKITPEEIDRIFISHDHWDHTGGIKYITDTQKDVTTYVPYTACKNFKRYTLKCIPIKEKPTMIDMCGISTGCIKTNLCAPEHEQALILNSSKGYVLITGCSHPGIVTIAKTSTNIVSEKLHLIIGGFHLYNQSVSYIQTLSEELKLLTEYIAPCHCTGDEAINIFKKLWRERFISLSAGESITF